MMYVGVGLYPLAALINHSCDPNCVAIFRGKTVHIRAIQEIMIGHEVKSSVRFCYFFSQRLAFG